MSSRSEQEEQPKTQLWRRDLDAAKKGLRPWEAGLSYRGRFDRWVVRFNT
jgi:hypothetical protein